MTTPSDTDVGVGTDTGWVTTGEVLGTCLWCGNNLMYAKPGNPPGDAVTDKPDFYYKSNLWRDYSLIDFPLQYGKFCPFAPQHPLGQYRIHQLNTLVPNPEQP